MMQARSNKPHPVMPKIPSYDKEVARLTVDVENEVRRGMSTCRRGLRRCAVIVPHRCSSHAVVLPRCSALCAWTSSSDLRSRSASTSSGAVGVPSSVALFCLSCPDGPCLCVRVRCSMECIRGITQSGRPYVADMPLCVCVAGSIAWCDVVWRTLPACSVCPICRSPIDDLNSINEITCISHDMDADGFSIQSLPRTRGEAVEGEGKKLVKEVDGVKFAISEKLSSDYSFVSATMGACLCRGEARAAPRSATRGSECVRVP